MVKPYFIFYIRHELNDVPEEYLSDEAIYSALKKAEEYINAIADSSTSSNLIEKAILYLATYYAYMNYVSIVTRALGSIPELVDTRMNSIKEVALSFVRLVTPFDIDNNFNVIVSGNQIVAFDTAGSL